MKIKSLSPNKLVLNNDRSIFTVQRSQKDRAKNAHNHTLMAWKNDMNRSIKGLISS